MLITSTIYALVAYYFGLQTILSDAVGGMIEGITDGFNDPVAATSYAIRILKWLVNHPSYFALVLFPVFSLASFLAFINSGYNYFEHLILNAYLTGQQTIVYLIFVPIIYVIGETYVVAMLELSCAAALTFWTYIQFFKGLSVIAKILQTILSYILYFLFLTLILFLFFALSNI